jgi:hypothetical protein
MRMSRGRHAVAAVLLAASAPAADPGVAPAAKRDRGAFLAALAEPGAHLWDKGPLVDPVRYAATQNAKDLLRSLFVKLALRPLSGPETARGEVLKTLEKLGP